MNFYEQIYSIEKKDDYMVAQAVYGACAGQKALFSKNGVVIPEERSPFWEEVYEQTKKTNQCNRLISVQDSKVFVEKLSEEIRLVICGTGHVSIQVIKLAKMLGFYVIAIDDREEFVNDARLAGADEAAGGEFRKLLKMVQGDQNTYFAIITRGHRSDRECLEEILYKDNAYIGMIGSKGRIANQFADMKAVGFSEELLEKVHAPIGLSIGAQTPEEIAVSVMAEIIAIKNGEKKTGAYTKKMLMAAAGRHPDYQNEGKAIVTIMDKHGSGPREVGTKMMVFDDGRIIGTIGGGTLEMDVIKKALECIERKQNQLFHYDMSLKTAEEEGMACGGSAELYIEVI